MIQSHVDTPGQKAWSEQESMQSCGRQPPLWVGNRRSIITEIYSSHIYHLWPTCFSNLYSPGCSFVSILSVKWERAENWVFKKSTHLWTSVFFCAFNICSVGLFHLLRRWESRFWDAMMHSQREMFQILSLRSWWSSWNFGTQLETWSFHKYPLELNTQLWYSFFPAPFQNASTAQEETVEIHLNTFR